MRSMNSVDFRRGWLFLFFHGFCILWKKKSMLHRTYHHPYHHPCIDIQFTLHIFESHRMNQEQQLVVGLVVAVIGVILQRRNRVVQHDSILTGNMHYQELMASENTHRFLSMTRMNRETFINLRNLLIRGGLMATVKMSQGEQLMIFIQVLKGDSVRKLAEEFQHSTSTISRVVHEVADCLMRNVDF